MSNIILPLKIHNEEWSIENCNTVTPVTLTIILVETHSKRSLRLSKLCQVISVWRWNILLG